MKKAKNNQEKLIKMAQGLNNIDQILEIVPKLKKMPVVDIGEVLSLVNNRFLIEIFEEFDLEEQGQIFAEFNLVKQLSYFQQISKKKFSGLFENMPSDDRADLFQIFTQQEQADLLPFLSKKIREDVISLSSYAPDTAGGIMNTDFATVKQDMTCAEAITKVREDSPSKKTIYYIYVVNEDETMQGFISLKDLIIADPDSLIKDVLHDQYVFGYVTDDSEIVANKIDKYELIAIPILNQKDQLVGIVTHDEAMDIIRAEQTEDMERFMGIMSSPDELDYKSTSTWKHFRKRIVWLVSLAAFGIFSGMIIHNYKNSLEQMMILALYMPMLADAGGNSGSQSATVVIRALALGQIRLKEWLCIIWKETKVSLLVALCLGALVLVKIVFFTATTADLNDFSLVKIGFVIALALALQIISSTIIGAGLPLLVKFVGGDPAVASSPAITTIVDISGLFIYLSLATMFFNF